MTEKRWVSPTYNTYGLSDYTDIEGLRYEVVRSINRGVTTYLVIDSVIGEPLTVVDDEELAHIICADFEEEEVRYLEKLAAKYNYRGTNNAVRSETNRFPSVTPDQDEDETLLRDAIARFATGDINAKYRQQDMVYVYDENQPVESLLDVEDFAEVDLADIPKIMERLEWLSTEAARVADQLKVKKEAEEPIEEPTGDDAA